MFKGKPAHDDAIATVSPETQRIDGQMSERVLVN